MWRGKQSASGKISRITSWKSPPVQEREKVWSDKKVMVGDLLAEYEVVFNFEAGIVVERKTECKW